MGTIRAQHQVDRDRHLAPEMDFASTARSPSTDQEKRWNMVWAIVIVLAVLWALGVDSSYAFGGFIHVLIAAAIMLAAYRIIQSRQVRRAS